MRYSTFIMMGFCALLVLPVSARAHGGAHKETVESAPVTLPSTDMTHTMPSDTPVDYGMGTEGGDAYGLGETAPPELPDEVPITLEELGAGSEHAGHDMKQMKEIKLAEHEWVSTSRKGYGMAAGITVLSGLGFLFLMLKRPCE